MFNMNPFSLMRRLSEEMDRSFSSGLQGRGHGQSGMWSPAIEVSERDGNYIVSAELPGLNKDNVNVEVTDDAVIIRGERKYEHEENQRGVHRTERHYGEFHRVVPLPEGINADQAKANFRDGVLEISVPMPQQRNRSRQIPIQTGSETQTNRQQTSNVAPEKK
jgi:HSP20 family protein